MSVNSRLPLQKTEPKQDHDEVERIVGQDLSD